MKNPNAAAFVGISVFLGKDYKKIFRKFSLTGNQPLPLQNIWEIFWHFSPKSFFKAKNNGHQKITKTFRVPGPLTPYLG